MPLVVNLVGSELRTLTSVGSISVLVATLYAIPMLGPAMTSRGDRTVPIASLNSATITIFGS